MGFLEWAEPLYLEAKAIRAEVLGEKRPNLAALYQEILVLGSQSHRSALMLLPCSTWQPSENGFMKTINCP